MLKQQLQKEIIENLRKLNITQILFDHDTDELILTLKPHVNGSDIIQYTQLISITPRKNPQQLSLGRVEICENQEIIFHGGRMDTESIANYISTVVLRDVVDAYKKVKA